MRSWFGRYIGFIRTAVFTQWLYWLEGFVGSTVGGSASVLPISITPSVTVLQSLRGWSRYLIVNLSNCFRSILVLSDNAIAAARFYRDWSYEIVGIKINQVDVIAEYSLLPTAERNSLRKRIERIENIFIESKKSKLLNEQSSCSKILLKDFNKEICSRQKDIHKQYRSIKREVFGRDKDREHICRMLRKEVDACGPSSNTVKKYSVIGIHGIAGSGKSTLAQYVCDYEKDKGKYFDDYEKDKGKYFDLVLFIHMPKTFEVDVIFRDMLEQMMPDQPSNAEDLEKKYIKDFESLTKKLEEELKGRRFLLVLDDVWVSDNENQMEEREILLHALNAAQSGSRVLVTAQTIGAAAALGAQEQILIPDMEEKEYLSLFMHHALQGAVDVDGEYERIGSMIAKRLHSSPIAAVTVAQRLRMGKSIGYWERTANLDVLSKTMGALCWSYQHLDVDIRRCFEYCSTFPRGYELERDKLVHLWIAQGFVKTGNETEDLEDLGQRYFDELLTFSFLQARTGVHYFATEKFIIHDLLHELAERIAGSDFFRVDVNASPKEIPSQVRHLFVETYNIAEIRENILELGNLRTLIIEEKHGSSANVERRDLVNEKVFENMFMRLKKLRVLIINAKHDLVFSVPASIGEMKHLCYLGSLAKKSVFQEYVTHKYPMIKQNSTLFPPNPMELIFPRTFTKIYHMQILDISNFKLSCTEDMANLVHLRQLPGRLDFPNIGRLTSLRTLPSEFVVKRRRGYELKQLKHLNKLQGTLKIYNLGVVGSKEEALEANLACKNRLKELSLVFNIHICNPNVEAEVLEGLCPPEYLVCLHISGYKGSRYPSWMMSREHLYAPKYLRTLELVDCTELAFIPEDSALFIHLHSLHIESCRWNWLPDNMEHLVSLQNLHISRCGNIKLLPKLPQSLEQIIIDSSHVLSRTCQEVGHVNWHQIRRIPQKSFHALEQSHTSLYQ